LDEPEQVFYANHRHIDRRNDGAVGRRILQRRAHAAKRTLPADRIDDLARESL